MRILYGLEGLPEAAGHSAIAIGNFDGMHLGHHRVLRFLHAQSLRRSHQSIVLTFYPHPRSVIGKGAVALIQTLDQRLEQIGFHQIDTTLVIPFQKNLAAVSAMDFLQDVLLDRLKAKEIIVGENFFFGRDREGSVSFLKKTAPQKGFRVFSCAPVKRDGVSISSSSIRDHLSAGRIEMANRMLGRPYSITGKVVHGISQGRNLGFPTANIRTANEIIPPGVHITCVHFGEQKLASITNVGDCPTIPGNKSGSIESYIIDFDGDLYGREIHLFFLKKLRDEILFPSAQMLRLQIQKDLKAARLYFSDHVRDTLC